METKGKSPDYETLSAKVNYHAIGKQIRAFRKQRRITQKSLAEKAGMSIQHLSHIECGSTKLSLPALVSLADVLEVDINIILGRNSTMAQLVLNNELADLLKNAAAEDVELCISVCRALVAARCRQRG